MVVCERDGPPAIPAIDLVLRALADPTRRDIVKVVLHSEQSVSALARRYPMSFAAVQKHVAILATATVITKHRHGREQLVRANIDALRRANQVFDDLEEIWRGRVARMAEILTSPELGVLT